MFCDCRTTNVQVPPSPHLYTEVDYMNTEQVRYPIFIGVVDFMYKYIQTPLTPSLYRGGLHVPTILHPPPQVTPSLYHRWTTCTITQSQPPSPSHLIFLRVVDFIHKYIQPHPQPIFIRVDYMNQHPPSPMSPHFFMVNYMYCTLYK